MNKPFTRTLSLVLYGGALALFGCEKIAKTELSPKSEQTQQLMAPPIVDTKLSPTQAAWLQFVGRVERGEQVDPSGQYVAKGTIVEADAAGRRPTRPKYDATKPEFYRHYTLQKKAASVSGGDTQYVMQPCVGEGCDTSGPGPATSIFVGSEGLAPYTGSDNPNGFIYDLKIVKGATAGISPLPGYTKLNLDLNRGAGGRYIYLTFVRRPSDVQLGDETGYGWSTAEIEGPVRALQAFEQPTGISVSWIFGGTPQPGYLPMWSPNPLPGSSWKQPDLNDGSSGSWVYGFQFKDPSFNARPIEVGIIAANYSHPVPPSGWEADYAQDLNEGAGGDYIYFCYKDR